jgi:cysteine-rich repeat protein
MAEAHSQAHGRSNGLAERTEKHKLWKPGELMSRKRRTVHAMQERNSRLGLLRFTAIVCSVVAAACGAPLHGEQSQAGGTVGNSGGASTSGGSSDHGGVPGVGGNGAFGGTGGWYTSTTSSREGNCSDGVIERREGCDDGNTLSGDGCSQDCRLEFGYQCPIENEPCIAVHTCGDGIIMPGEYCDDGNTISGDGCSRDCGNIERG